MKGGEGNPVVLAVSRAASFRRRVAEALEPEFAVRGAAPRELLSPGPLLDAAASVVELDGRAEDLEPLLGLPAGRCTTLVSDGHDAENLEAALQKLVPAQVLSEPASSEMLRYAVRRSLPPGSPGEGARPQQRPAVALLGVSAAIREVMEQVRQIAPTPLPALILGETGTGKEIVARAIHEQSPRAERPFVAVNCAALTDTLLESELFGHRKGAFTGALRDKRGLFEEADGGTIFLDEIGDTSPALQMKLLRVLETKEVRPVGDTRDIRVDARVVSATHRNIEKAIEQGSFRQDLFYRLNAVTIWVPPLRRRRVDVPFLAQHFAEEFGAGEARRIVLSDDFLEGLSERDFPGNVRELRNQVERAIALATPGEPVTSSHLEPPPGGTPPSGVDLDGTLREVVDRVECAAIRAALERAGGSRRAAAKELGLTPPGLRYKMGRLGLLDPA